MKSNYSPLGNYINELNERNSNLTITKLLGVSMEKKFIPSVANLNGVDMSIYKVLRNEQLACKLMSVGRDEKLPVDLYKGEQPALVSSAYYVFEPKDKEELLPEYLLLWLCRPENDRYIGFISGGDVRGGISWETFCSLPIKVPSINKQREIVKEYNIIQNRIALNQQMIQKLEETAQTIYKQWFVDFEFPDEIGRPYKSNGGKMAESELGLIPKGWEPSTLGCVLEKKGYIRGPFGSALKVDDMQTKGIPVYEQQHILDKHRNFRYFISEKKYNQLKRFSVQPYDILISCSGINLGELSTINNSDTIGIINQALLILRINSQIINPICVKYFLETEDGKRLLIQESGGSAQPNIAKREIIQSIPFLIPLKRTSDKLGRLLKIIDEKVENSRKLNDGLVHFKNLLLSKLATIEN